MYARNLAEALLRGLGDTPAVLIAGGRQTGKTTLARALAEGPFRARYVTLDDPTVVAAARTDPSGFLAGLDGPVVLDEVQQAPELFPVLRREIDRDRTPGRFLLTGSAQVTAVPEIAAALVGRLEVRTLWPLSQGEIEGVREGFAAAVLSRDLPPFPGEGEERDAIWRRVLRGGFPEPLGRSPERATAWFEAYVSLLLQRDVRDLARIEGLALLPRLVELLAARAGALVNFAELSRSSALPQTTLKRYFSLLEAVFLLTRLPAWSANPTKRLAKAPKLFFVDSGLLAHVARLDLETVRERPHVAGHVLECFVAMELVKQSGWSAGLVRLHHFRTGDGREVDVVLEDRLGRVVGIEVKSASSVARSDFRGLEALAEAAGSAFHRGVVLYLGSEPVAFGERLHALPLPALWTLGAAPQAVRIPAP